MSKTKIDGVEWGHTKSRNGVKIYTALNKEERAKSDHVFALYRINHAGKPKMQCVPVDEVEGSLQTMELFHYKDAKAICDGKLDVEDYAKENGYLKVEAKKAEKKKSEVEAKKAV